MRKAPSSTQHIAFWLPQLIWATSKWKKKKSKSVFFTEVKQVRERFCDISIKNEYR